MNNKGFAIAGIFYGILILFLTTIILMLFSLQNKKTVLDKLKSESVSAVECNDNMDYVLEQLSSLKKTVNGFSEKIDNMYPIGSIYISESSKNPSELFGGTWISYGQGRTLVGLSDNATVGSTGGSNSVKLTAANIPSLTSTGSTTSKDITTNSTGSGYSIGYGASTRTTSSSGSHQHYFTPSGSVHSVFTNGGAALTLSGSNETTSGFAGGPNWSGVAAGRSGITTSFYGSRALVEGAGAHTHTVSDYYANSISGVQAHTHTLTVPALTATTTYTNSNQTDVSVQNPYITVYMWKRTA